MDSLELLVHISAPGTIHHDRQNLALAQAIMAFRPVETTRVMAQDPDFEIAPSESRNRTTTDLPAAQNGLKRRAESLDEGRVQGRRDYQVKRAKHGLIGSLNPPYRNPWRGKVDHLQVLETPAPSRRPQTAPDISGGTIQVPRTHTERRRAYSDSVQSTNTRISNSQDAMQVDESSEGRISSPLGIKHVFQRLSQTSLEDTGGEHRGISSSATNVTLPQRGKSGSPHSSSTMTASPSQPLQGIDGQRPYSSQPVPDKSPSIVTLSSGSSHLHSSSSPSGMRKNQTNRQRNVQHATSRGTHRSVFVEIEQLAEEVCAPQPETDSMESCGHVTRHLQELLDALPLEKLFRPINVTRDIRNLERGYWLMQITIAPEAAVRQARTSPNKQKKVQRCTDRFSGATAQERLNQYWEAKAAGKLRSYDYGDEDAAVGLWTEKEFIDFWNGFSDFIRDGKAGWAVRMVRDEADDDNDDRSGDECRYLRVRIFTWGQTIGHIYLAIWLCSDKLSMRVPMEWIAGEDGTVVVAMSGKKKYGGTLKPFVHKDGCWGLSES